MTTRTVSATLANPWRQARLERGWEPLDVVGRIKSIADSRGLILPPGWLLIHWLFLWENHRTLPPAFYAGMLAEVLATNSGGAR